MMMRSEMILTKLLVYKLPKLIRTVSSSNIPSCYSILLHASKPEASSNAKDKTKRNE